ncbi:hypothetical protein SANTM175S_00315 [Streptomyces antimycoticus]
MVIPLARAHRPGIGGQLCFRDTSRASEDRRNRDGGHKGGLRPHLHRTAVLRVQGGARLLGSGPIARGQVAAIAGARKGAQGCNVPKVTVELPTDGPGTGDARKGATDSPATTDALITAPDTPR